jgi:hypothetical protein
VRFVFLDEGGISKPSDPHIVVSGAMVHADSQYKKVEQYLQDLADEFCLPQDRHGFYFHASELSWGSEEFRARYDKSKRLFFLRSLCDIPRRFSLPVFMHSVRRSRIVEKNPELNSHDQIITRGLLHASAGNASYIEKYMRMKFPDEVALLVYEQNGKKSDEVRDYHNIFRTPGLREYVANTPDSNMVEFTKIIDTAHFARKEDNSLLQIADAAIHVFTRKLRGSEVDQRCFQSLLKQLAFHPPDWTQDYDALPESWPELTR